MDKKSKESSISVGSAFSVTESAKSRFQIAYKGVLKISRNENELLKPNFQSYNCSLTNDGRFIIQPVVYEGNIKSESKEVYIIQECILSDMKMFRLTALEEKKLENRNSIDIICMSETHSEQTEWLIQIENAMRFRLQEYRNELDCARGTLEIVEVNPSDVLDIKLFKSPKSKTLQCFYYNQMLRVKDLSGKSVTSQFRIKDLQLNDIEWPLCMLIKTTGLNLFCRVKDQDLDTFQKWVFSIGRDIANEKSNKIKSDIQNQEQVIQDCDCLMGLVNSPMVRVTTKYSASDRILETRDFVGVTDAFYLIRCYRKVELNFKLIKVPKSTNHEPPFDEDSGQLVFVVCMNDDLTEKSAFEINFSCEPSKEALWSRLINPDMNRFIILLNHLIEQIEIRRIMNLESSSKKNTQSPSIMNVTFHELHYLLSISEAHKESEATNSKKNTDSKKASALVKKITNSSEWPVQKLERSIQQLLRLLPEPLIERKLQREFFELGQQIQSDCFIKNSHLEQIKILVQKMDIHRRDILQRLVVHIYALTTHFSELKQASGTSKPSCQDKVKVSSKSISLDKVNDSNAKNNQEKSSIGKSDLVVWTRMSKYIFRLEEIKNLNLSEEALISQLDSGSLAILCFQAMYIVQLRKQTLQCSNYTNRKTFDRMCSTN